MSENKENNQTKIGPNGEIIVEKKAPAAKSSQGVRPAGAAPAGARPTGPRPAGAAPAGARPAGPRPAGARPTGARPAGNPDGLMGRPANAGRPMGRPAGNPDGLIGRPANAGRPMGRPAQGSDGLMGRPASNTGAVRKSRIEGGIYEHTEKKPVEPVKPVETKKVDEVPAAKPVAAEPQVKVPVKEEGREVVAPKMPVKEEGREVVVKETVKPQPVAEPQVKMPVKEEGREIVSPKVPVKEAGRERVDNRERQPHTGDRNGFRGDRERAPRTNDGRPQDGKPFERKTFDPNRERSDFRRDGNRDFQPRTNDGQRPFGQRPQGQGGSFGGNRPAGGGQGRNFGGQSRPQGQGGNFGGGYGNRGGFTDKDMMDKDAAYDNRRNQKSAKQTPAKKVSADLNTTITKNQRATKLNERGRDKNRDRRFESENGNEIKHAKGKDPNRKGAFIKPEPKAPVVEDDIKQITVPEVITIKELADKMKIQPAVLLKKFFLEGKLYQINSEITFEDAENIAIEYDIICEKEVPVNIVEELLKEDADPEDTLVKRPPVVCVMGHVDHGKTSLLDAVRRTNVTEKEAGGITQKIGAYIVEINGNKIAFLDTPGHEAFTSMRMRGAQSTDIAILVVAADDGVMPQTVEAINHAKAANVPIIVAMNKIDKPAANIERLKQEMTEHGLVAEDWGGDTVFVPVSAKTGEGIENLLEMVILTADMLELKANPDRKARGIVIEAQLDKGRGPVATVLVQKGTLKVGDNLVIGPTYGRVRAMLDDTGKRVKEATPSTPVEIIGLNGVPQAGEIAIVTDSDKDARNIAEAFIAQGREKLLADTKAKLSLDGLYDQIQAGNMKELNLIIKADVQGSVEAVRQSLEKLSDNEVQVKVIHGAVGAINESDVVLASASKAIIIGFNVKTDSVAKEISEREKVDIRLYDVIYNAIEDVRKAMDGMLDPIYEEKVIGHAEIRKLFKASQLGVIAGSYILDGKVQRGCNVRLTREGELVYEGKVASLKREKDDAKEVNKGFECGIFFEKFNECKELDIAEFYVMEEVPRK